jgi:uncharacterized RDD family membrane protein YckC
MLIDWLCILGWLLITAVVGVSLYASGLSHPMSALASNLLAALVTAVPVTVGLTLLESSPREASVGKRTRQLRVVDAATGLRVPFRRSLLRNTLKLGVPWTIGHAAVYAIVQSGGSGLAPASVWLLTVVAYVLPILYVGSLFVGEGRAPYDRVSGTLVIRDVHTSVLGVQT